jgi:hypothetical protein
VPGLYEVVVTVSIAFGLKSLDEIMYCCKCKINRHKRLFSIMFEGGQFNMVFFSPAL